MTYKEIVYQQDVIEFVTVAVQTCLFLEKSQDNEPREFIDKATKLLPLLYLKTKMLNLPQSTDEEDELMHFVAEEDYNYVEQGVSQILGQDNAYLEVFVDDMRYSDTPITAFISENLADIYQELKDMAANFQTENEPAMYAALRQCLDAFNEHWGQKLLNALRALHALTNKETDDVA